jgi:hypothetical protein
MRPQQGLNTGYFVSLAVPAVSPINVEWAMHRQTVHNLYSWETFSILCRGQVCQSLTGAKGGTMKHFLRYLTILALMGCLPLAAHAVDPEIAYMVGGTQRSIEVMDADGSNPTEVYRPQKFTSVGLPSWSPDGASLTFADQGKLYRIDVDHLTVYPDGWLIAPIAGSVYSRPRRPAWSPAGREIALIASSLADSICVVDEWGQGDLEAVYVAPENFRLHWLAWNGSGDRIAFTESDAEGAVELAIINRFTGTVERRFPAGDYPRDNFTDLDWARNNDPRIAFHAGQPRQDTWVYTIDSTTGEVVPIVQGRMPSWSPDNSKLVFTNFSAKLKVFSFTTGEIDNLGGNGYYPDWKRGSISSVCETAQDCFDGNPCTDDACVTSACTHFPNSLECDDGNECTDNDICLNGTCTGTGLAEGALCSSGLCCTGWCQDVCFNNAECDDNDLLTVDTCLNSGTCSSTCENVGSCGLQGDPCASDNDCCSGRCHPVKGVCK